METEFFPALQPTEVSKTRRLISKFRQDSGWLIWRKKIFKKMKQTNRGFSKWKTANQWPAVVDVDRQPVHDTCCLPTTMTCLCARIGTLWSRSRTAGAVDRKRASGALLFSARVWWPAAAAEWSSSSSSHSAEDIALALLATASWRWSLAGAAVSWSGHTGLCPLRRKVGRYYSIFVPIDV